MPSPSILVGAALLALGTLRAGWLIGDAFQRGRAAEHYVTVKGLAETFVVADLAIWPLRYTATGDDHNQVQAKIDAEAAEITAFLTREGIAAEAIVRQRVAVTDLLAQAWRPKGAASNRSRCGGLRAATLAHSTRRVGGLYTRPPGPFDPRRRLARPDQVGSPRRS